MTFTVIINHACRPDEQFTLASYKEAFAELDRRLVYSDHRARSLFTNIFRQLQKPDGVGVTKDMTLRSLETAMDCCGYTPLQRRRARTRKDKVKALIRWYRWERKAEKTEDRVVEVG